MIYNIASALVARWIDTRSIADRSSMYRPEGDGTFIYEADVAVPVFLESDSAGIMLILSVGQSTQIWRELFGH